MDNSKEIIEIVKDYCNDQAAEYSIMITGQWGAGKTFFIKNSIEPNVGKEILYVSLNGIKDLGDIDKQIVLSVYPILDSKSVKAVGSVAGAALKYFKLDGLKEVVDIKDLPKKINDKILCFDDIERAKIDIDQLLGYINKFVEHMAIKTLLICNEDKISNVELYKDIKEKIIGITLKYTPDYVDVIDTIIRDYSEIDPKYYDFLKSTTDIIGEVFNKSESTNIRILKQSVIYFRKIYYLLSTIENEYINYEAICKFHLSTFFESRLGKIDEVVFEKYLSDIQAFWMAKYFNDKENKEKNYIENFLDRYFDGQESNVIFLNSIYSYIKSGYIDVNNLNAEIESKFISADTPINPEQILLENYWILDDEQFEESCKTVLDNIKNGHEYSQELYLKYFYNLLYFSEKKCVNVSPKELLDIFSNGAKIAGKTWSYRAIETIPLFGEEPNSEEYLLFKKRLIDINDKLEEESKVEKSLNLFSKAEGNYTEFVNLLGLHSTHDFLQIPVFLHCSPDDVVKLLLTLSNAQLVDFLKAVKHRYSIENTLQFFTDEVDNLQEIVVKLRECTANSPRKLSVTLLSDISIEFNTIHNRITSYIKNKAQQAN
jgi:hypothetical protein